MKLRYLIGSAVCVGMLCACQDEMNYHEYANNDKTYIEQSYIKIGGLVTNIYAQLDADFGNYDGATLASACDEAEYVWTESSVHDFYNGSWSPVNPIDNWTKSYAAIQQCNMFLEEYTGLTFPDLMLNQDYKAQMYRYKNYEYEVRFLRAYFYFNLVRQYGDIPFTTTVPSTEEVNTLTRKPAQEVFQFIADECDAIAPEIIVDYSDLGDLALPSEPAETGRAGRLAVLALKARSALYAASPLFNPDMDKELWKKAAEANKAVIDSCRKYNKVLATAYDQIWGADNYTNNEMIFVRRMDRDGTNSFEKYNFPIGVEGGNSGNCPTQTLVDAYEMQATGKLWNEERSGYDPANPYEGRDPRFELTIAKNGDVKWPLYNTQPLQIYYGGVNGEPLSGATPTGYYLKKYCDVSVNLTASATNKKRHSWVTYRLGEFYLNYAEAVFKYMGSADLALPGDENPLTAREAVNVVRNRVNMPELPAGLDTGEFWKKYKNERMIELAFEGHRFWDVRRWKEGELLKSVTFMKITKNSNGTFNYTRQERQRMWDDKMYFFPIPQSELMKNKNLTQNPGWEN